MSDDSDVNKMLEEEREEEEQFHKAHLSSLGHPGACIGIVHSATTDTLDSVMLEPTVTEQDLSDIEDAGQDVSEYRDRGEVEPKDLKDIDFTMDGTDTEISGSDNEAKNDEKQEKPSLSKYFSAGQTDSDPFGDNFFDSIVTNSDTSKEPQVTAGGDNREVKKAGEVVNAEETETEEANDMMLELTIDDAMKPSEEDQKVELADEGFPSIQSLENSSNNAFIEQSVQESVMFDMDLPEGQETEDPVEFDDKEEDFESFTADLAENEALDALGMSPATHSFMNDRTFQDFRNFTDLSRQTSVNSTKSGGSNHDQNLDLPSTPLHLDKGTNLTPLITPTVTPQSSVPPTHTHQSIGSASDTASESVQDTPTHQPVVSPSATLTPVDSPAHQAKPSMPKLPGDDTETPTSTSLPTSPEHIPGLMAAFQTFHDADDPFSASLQMSDSDRSHDAWIPSDTSKTKLMTIATSAPGTYSPPEDQLCRPYLVVTEPQGDPVRDLVNRYMGEQEALKRQQLTVINVSEDIEGLKKLMESGCYRSAVDLAGVLLTQHGQGNQVVDGQSIQHSPETLQLWYTRFSLMMRLRMYGVVESEMQAFMTLDTPDIYYEFYPQVYPGKRGSMAVFGFRLLHAELPHHLGRSTETLDRLYYILAITQKIIKNLEEGLSEDGSAVTISAESRKTSQELWMERENQTYYLIGNTLMSIRDYEAALSVYEMLLEKDSQHRVPLLSGMGRIHLQMGNLLAASEYFLQVTNSDAETPDACTRFMNAGFEAMCQNNFEKAYINFKSAVQTEPGNTSAVNNMAVCCLYMGQLKDALKTLEALVHRDPNKNLHEGILFNLCTLYELESSRALHKKQALLDLVSKHKGDGFPVVCLKMA